MTSSLLVVFEIFDSDEMIGFGGTTDCIGNGVGSLEVSKEPSSDSSRMSSSLTVVFAFNNSSSYINRNHNQCMFILLILIN